MLCSGLARFFLKRLTTTYLINTHKILAHISQGKFLQNDVYVFRVLDYF